MAEKSLRQAWSDYWAREQAARGKRVYLMGMTATMAVATVVFFVLAAWPEAAIAAICTGIGIASLRRMRPRRP
jgi:hypothetical protein